MQNIKKEDSKTARATVRTYVALYKAKGSFINKFIRVWTGSKYSHCGIVIDDTIYSSCPRCKGVVLDGHMIDNKDWDYVEVHNLNTDGIKRFYDATKGYKYDLIGIMFSQLFPFGRQRSDMYFCSEWCYTAMLIGGLVECAGHNPSSISPEKLYKIAKSGSHNYKHKKRKLSKKDVNLRLK